MTKRALFGLSKLHTRGLQITIPLTGLLALAVAAPSCDKYTEPGDSQSFSPGGPDPEGLGVGVTCSNEATCRPGLACSEKKVCEPAHNSPEGTACVISDECADGLFCAPTRVCAPVGEGKQGDGCSSDGDCGSGLKCSLAGFSTQCLPEGSGDLGAPCKAPSDCFGGLGCLQGVCGQVPPGMPPFGIPTWAGGACKPDESSTLKAYFEVPRGKDDGDFYRLPFPNDIRLKGGHPDLTGHPSPGSDMLGFDPLGRYINAIEKGTNGWGVYPTVVFRFSGAVDLGSFANDKHPGAIRWIDVTAGTQEYSWRRGWYSVASTARTKYICPNWMAIRPPTGEPLLPGHTYAVVLSTEGRGEDGTTPIARDKDFEAMLASSTPSDAGLAAAWKRYAPLRAYLDDQKQDPKKVLDAAVFTVGPVRAPVEGLKKAIDALPAPTASGWIRCGDAPSPCPQADGARGCGSPDPAFDELQALVQLPIFQKGTAPYLKPEDGGGFDYDANGTPKVVRQEKVCLSLTVPKGATMPADGWPLVVYAHGTGGSYRSHVLEGVAGRLSNVKVGNTDTHFAVLGIDQVQHGPRRGASTDSPNNLFFNFANPLAAKYNVLQGAADQMALFKFAATLAQDASVSPTGSAWKIDGGKMSFWGHSQGATEGAIALPYIAAARGVVLSGNGASLRDSLLNKTSPVNVAAALPFVLLDPDSHGKLNGAELNPALALLQLWIDSSDPLAYASQMTTTPPTTDQVHHVFQPFGQLDTFSPGITQVTYAIAARLQTVKDATGVTANADELLGLKPSSSNAGNLTVEGHQVTALLRRYSSDGYDGHFVAFKNKQAKEDIDRFLGQSIAETAPQVGP